MIVPDINLLLYAYDAGSPFHSKAAAWWQRCWSGTEPVGLAQVAMFGLSLQGRLRVSRFFAADLEARIELSRRILSHARGLG